MNSIVVPVKEPATVKINELVRYKGTPVSRDDKRITTRAIPWQSRYMIAIRRLTAFS